MIRPTTAHEIFQSLPAPCREKMKQALCLLATSAEYASQLGREPWDFAVNISRLEKTGLDSNDFRLLLFLGMVECADETSGSILQRRFQSVDPLVPFGDRCCFILTEAGCQLTQPAEMADCPAPIAEPAGPGQPPGCFRPVWDPSRRELLFSDQLVKRFKWTAVNQEAILNAFQEEDWPRRVFDPLSPDPEIDCKRRLADTIKCLNQRHHFSIIRFRGDGTGQGVKWEQVNGN